MEFLRYGEEGIRIVFGNDIDLEVHERVRKYYYFIKTLKLEEIVDIVPSFRSCFIHFDGRAISFNSLTDLLAEEESKCGNVSIPGPRRHEIPVMYGGEYGPDMEFICAYSGLSEGDVVEIHTSSVYTVFAIGFMPGFPYLGSLDRRLYTPRLEIPRLKVPEGSVGIAQLQTGIYPFESPAGWRILGKTDMSLFDYRKEPYSLLAIGDLVKFVSV